MSAVLERKSALDKQAAWDIVGGLSTPSKMPGYAYGLPAKACQVGSALRTIPNSVCNKCYAFRGHYMYANVQNAQARRLEAIRHPRWTEAMTYLMHCLDVRWFRWHDSGDIQSPSHLANIVAIARACPDVRFWLPTREKLFVTMHQRAHGQFPKNLVVRVSAAMIDGPPPEYFRNTSTVTTGAPSCPSHKQNNECGTCRRCWDPKVKNVSYRKH